MNFEYNNINIINGDSNIILDSITDKSIQLIW